MVAPDEGSVMSKVSLTSTTGQPTGYFGFFFFCCGWPPIAAPGRAVPPPPTTRGWIAPLGHAAAKLSASQQDGALLAGVGLQDSDESAFDEEFYVRKWRHFVGRTGLDWVGWLFTTRRSGFVSSVPVGVYKKKRPL